MRYNDLAPGSLFKYKDERDSRVFMMVDNKTFAVGGERDGNVARPVHLYVRAYEVVEDRKFGSLMTISNPGPGGIEGIEVIQLDALVDEVETGDMFQLPYGAFFMHEGLGEVLVKTDSYAAKHGSGIADASTACLCARAKDGALVLLPSTERIVRVRVSIKAAHDRPAAGEHLECLR